MLDSQHSPPGITCIITLDSLDAGLPNDFKQLQYLAEDNSIELFLALPSLPQSKTIRSLKERFPQAQSLTYSKSPCEAINSATQYAAAPCICLLKVGVQPHLPTLGAMCKALLENPNYDALLAWLPQTGHKSANENSTLGIVPCNYADALFSRQGHGLLLWKKPQNDLKLFDESFFFLADHAYALDLAQKNRLLVCTGGGLYSPGKKDVATQYRQAVYEEELALKEKHLRHFLSDALPFSEELENRLLLHTKTIVLYYKQLSTGNADIDVEEFDRQAFLYALLLAKSGATDKARKTLHDHLKIIGNSRNGAHLYRVLLTPFLSGPVLILPPSRPKALISIPMALYNHGRYLETALRSVFAQTIPDWELVITNDGSTDDSLKIAKELLKKYADPRLRIVSKANEGLPKTRTRGMLETSAPYICQLDPDDLIAPDYFEKALHILETEADVGWVTPKTLVFGGNNHIVWDWEYDFIYSLIRSPSPALALFRRSMWEDAGGYRDDISCREDWEFWIRSGEHGWRSKTTDDVLFIYRHAFARWGVTPKFNLSSKATVVNMHPWWFKKLPANELRKIFLVHGVAAFPEEFLEPKAVARFRACTGGRDAIRRTVLEMAQAF